MSAPGMRHQALWAQSGVGTPVRPENRLVPPSSLAAKGVVRQIPLKVVEEELAPGVRLARIAYPGGVTRWGLRKYVTDRHFIVVGKTHKTAEGAIAAWKGGC